MKRGGWDNMWMRHSNWKLLALFKECKGVFFHSLGQNMRQAWVSSLITSHVSKFPVFNFYGYSKNGTENGEGPGNSDKSMHFLLHPLSLVSCLHSDRTGCS